MDIASPPSPENCSPLEFVDPNLTIFVLSNLGDRCVSPSLVAPTVIIYCVILLLGIFGNICTCLVILKNKCMHQTATNYYLFSLAISDLLMLVLGLPMELYGVFDVLYPYRFGEIICKSRAFLIEFTSYASILTITCFSIERWLAICFPLKVKVFSTFDRAVKVIIACWISAFIAALPVAWIVVINRLPVPDYVFEEEWYAQVTDDNQTLIGTDYCAMDFTRPIAQKNFIYGAFLLFFLLPALLITLVYCHIVITLHSSTKSLMADNAKHKETRKSLLKILVSVVVMFFLCWLPFHIQRLLTIYLNESDSSVASSAIHFVFNLVFYISGYCYYSNSACNPILYNILSQKYRIAFCRTILGKRFTERFLNKNCSTYRFHFQTFHTIQQFAPASTINNKFSTVRAPSLGISSLPDMVRNGVCNGVNGRRNYSLQQNGTVFCKGNNRRLQSTLSNPVSSSSNGSTANGSPTTFSSSPSSTILAKEKTPLCVSMKGGKMRAVRLSLASNYDSSLLKYRMVEENGVSENEANNMEEGEEEYDDEWPNCGRGMALLSRTLPLIDDV